MATGTGRIFVGLVALTLVVLPVGRAQAQDALNIDAAGDVGIGTEAPAETLHVFGTDGSTKVLVVEDNGAVVARELFKLTNNGGPFFVFSDSSLAESWSFAMGSTGDFIQSHQQSPGVELRLTENGNLTIEGVLTEGSSRSIKNSFGPVDQRDVLERVLALPVSTWQYNGDTARHLGPMAEDFHAAFGLGATDKGIASLDTGGVALAAIQGLNTKLEEREREIAQLRGEKEALAQRLATLEERVGRLVPVEQD